MKKILTLLALLILSITGFSQSKADKQKAYDLGMQAIKLMDNSEIDKSIELLQQSCKLDPKNHNYPYEIGYAYYLKKDYSKSIEYFEKVVKMGDINAQCYQMLGNAYDLNGDADKAIASYNDGLKKFPNAGRLYLELGNMNQKDWNKALEFYEKGIEVDPKYSSNYYWAAKIFCNSTEEMWGMIYGELFMNIERGSKRTEEISKLLFDTYFSEIKFTSNTSASVSFSQKNIIDITKKKPTMPFSLIYEPGLLFATINEDTITIESLNRIRTKFINFYFDRKFNKSHSCILFNWHKELIDNEKLECYNYWVLMQGAPDEFNSWYSINKERFDNFIRWFSENPMVIDEKHRFHRKDY